MALVHNNPALQSLDIAGLGVTDSFLRELSCSCTGLTALRLSITNVEGDSLGTLWRGCPYLQKLDFNLCNVVTSPANSISTSMRELNFDNTGIDDQTLQELLVAFPALTGLEICECDQLLELQDLPLGQLCPHLRTLIIADSASTAGDVLLRNLADHCAELRVLHIPESRGVTDATLCTVARCSRHLQKLDLCNCFKVTDNLLNAIAEHCAELKQISITGCDKVTSRGVKAVLQGCPKITDFSVDGCYRLTAKVKRAIAERCPGNGWYRSDDE
jgi:hypothetical protein